MTILDVINSRVMYTEEKPVAMPFLTVCSRCKADLYLALNAKTWSMDVASITLNTNLHRDTFGRWMSAHNDSQLA